MKKTHARSRLGRPPGPHAAYRQVLRDLRTRLAQGEWAPGEPLPSLRQFAAHYKTSLSTIQVAVDILKEEVSVKPGPLKQLFAMKGRAEAAGRQGVLLIVLSDPLERLCRSHLWMELFRGIQSGMEGAPGPLSIVHGFHLRDALPYDFLEEHLSGIILFGYFATPVIRQYERLSVSVVWADHPPADYGIHTVSVDNVAAARAATLRLIEQGHRNLAFLRKVHSFRGELDADSVERQKGFQEAIAKAGLPKQAGAIFNILNRDTAQSPTVQALFRAHPPLTGLVCADPHGAWLVSQAAAEKGCPIPERMSVVSFQALGEQSQGVSGPATDFEELGLRAVKLTRQPRHPAQHPRIPAHWHEGRSLGPPLANSQ